MSREKKPIIRQNLHPLIIEEIPPYEARIYIPSLGESKKIFLPKGHKLEESRIIDNSRKNLRQVTPISALAKTPMVGQVISPRVVHVYPQAAVPKVAVPMIEKRQQRQNVNFFYHTPLKNVEVEKNKKVINKSEDFNLFKSPYKEIKLQKGIANIAYNHPIRAERWQGR